MSHYARLIAPLKVVSCHGVSYVLPVNTLVKLVKLEDGQFRFMASMKPGELHEGWLEWHTTEDLPAFTDKGSAHRDEYAKRLSVGRPMRGESPMSERLVCKVSPVQQKWVLQTAAAHDTSVSEFVRKALISSGMPE